MSQVACRKQRVADLSSKHGRQASFPGLPTVQFMIACSMQKQRGEAWFMILAHEWHQCLPTLRGGEGSPLERTSLSPYVVVSTPSTGVLNVCKAKNILVQNKGSFNQRPLPPIYQGRYWCHSHGKVDQDFPLCFCILQAFKNWTVGRPGNEAKSAHMKQKFSCFSFIMHVIYLHS